MAHQPDFSDQQKKDLVGKILRCVEVIKGRHDPNLGTISMASNARTDLLTSISKLKSHMDTLDNKSLEALKSDPILGRVVQVLGQIQGPINRRTGRRVNVFVDPEALADSLDDEALKYEMMGPEAYFEAAQTLETGSENIHGDHHDLALSILIGAEAELYPDNRTATVIPRKLLSLEKAALGLHNLQKEIGDDALKQDPYLGRIFEAFEKKQPQTWWALRKEYLAEALTDEVRAFRADPDKYFASEQKAGNSADFDHASSPKDKPPSLVIDDDFTPPVKPSADGLSHPPADASVRGGTAADLIINQARGKELTETELWVIRNQFKGLDL